MEETRCCKKCNTIKPIIEFKPCSPRNGKVYYRHICKVCYRLDSREYNKIWRQSKKCKDYQRMYQESWYNKKVSNRKASRKQNWKLTNVDMNEVTYNQLRESQDFKCAICNTHESDFSRNQQLVVDHCHSTGRIRGLLCYRCNLGLGNFQDSLDMLLKAVEYLKEDKSTDNRKESIV